MLADNTVALVMPCRNEAGHLADVIRDVPEFFDEIICVSNQSTDSTVQVGRAFEKTQPRVHLIIDDRVSRGIGYGYAHMSGIHAAKSKYIVCADADGTYPIADARKLIPEMQRRSLQFVSCSRYPDRQIPMSLQLGVKALNMEILCLYGFRIRDSLSGMWIFEREIVPKIHLTEGDWNLSPQIKLNARRYLKGSFAEFKVKQAIRRGGESKQRYVLTGLRHFWWIATNRFKLRTGIQVPD